MNSVAATLSKIPGAELVATEQGTQWLEEHPSFFDLAKQFSETRDRPERYFEKTTFIGMGENSEVRCIGGIAVKVATPTTGRASYNHGCGIKPENLVGQFRLLIALDECLTDHTDITIPEQYFALHTRAGDLRAEQYMIGWVSLYALARDRDYPSDQAQEINEAVKRRVVSALGRSVFKPGLDLGLGNNEYLHSRNILTPEHIDNPETGPLCIIDQPATGIAGFITTAILTVRFRLAVSRKTNLSAA